MRTFHRNYIFEQLMEQFEGSGGSSDKSTIDTKLFDIKNAIIQGQTDFPEGGQAHLKWMYYCLINNIQTTVDPSNLVKIEGEDSIRFYELWSNYKEVPPALNEWIAKYCIGDSSDDLTPFASKTKTALCQKRQDGVFYNENADLGWFKKDNSTAANAIYEYHKRAITSYKASQKIDINVVYNFLKNPQWPDDRNALATQNQTPSLDAIIEKLPKPPQIDFNKVTEEAALVDPDNYETVHNYAPKIGIDVRQAVAAITHFAAVSCPTPYATLDIVQAMQELRKGIDISQLGNLVQQQEEGFIGRLFNRYRPKPYEQTPFYEVTELAQTLPQKAREDADSHGKHVRILQKGLDIIHGYDDSLREYIKALTERKDVIDKEKADNPHEAEELTTRMVADGILNDTIDNKLNDLKLTRAFARAHAANFATLMLHVMKAKSDTENMAGLAANILLPAQQIQRAFMAYQSSQFGEAVNANNMIIDGVATEIDKKLSVTDAKDAIEQSMRTLSLMVGKIETDLSSTRGDIIDIAKQTEEAAAKGEAVKVNARSPA
jgi:hypothetical protein